MTSMSELVETNLNFLSHWAINSRYAYGLPTVTLEELEMCISSAGEIYKVIEDEFKQRGII